MVRSILKYAVDILLQPVMDINCSIIVGVILFKTGHEAISLNPIEESCMHL